MRERSCQNVGMKPFRRGRQPWPKTVLCPIAGLSKMTHTGRQHVDALDQNLWELLPQKTTPLGRTVMPRSKRKPRIWLITAVRMAD
jgi:hypothetical protein